MHDLGHRRGLGHGRCNWLSLRGGLRRAAGQRRAHAHRRLHHAGEAARQFLAWWLRPAHGWIGCNTVGAGQGSSQGWGRATVAPVRRMEAKERPASATSTV